MIERHQIAEALGRLEPRDREILDYSLRRRVPDADLATIFDSDAAEVARQRTAAIEKLSSDLGVQRGADLGHILKELLEGATWDQVNVSAPAAAPPQSPDGNAEPPPSDASETPAGHKPLGAIDFPEPAAAPAPQPEPEPEPEREPVPGMLGDPSPQGPGSRDTAQHHRRGRRRALVGAAAALAVLAPAGVVYALTVGDGATSAGGSSSASGTRDFAPQPGGAAEPFPSHPQSAYQYPTARVTRRTALYRAPGGKVRLRISPKTEWDSPRVLGVVERRGKWLAVLAPQLKNGQKAWVREDKVAEVSTVSWSVNADLSKRRMTVKHDGKTVRTMKIGVGRPDHPTPVGRYAVTDKLRVSDPGSPYGCCVLALTGHQTRLPAGWPGGDRLAVHATQDLSGLGKRVSLGCMRTDPKDTKWMLTRIPLGTPVFVRS